MENGDDTKRVFPLTSLQIGDLKSYQSDLNLFLPLESKKFYILVDNRPRLPVRDLSAGPARLWQFIVRWIPFIHSQSRLHRTLYGLTVLEVGWDSARGINYFNELQTDTSLAIETKFMQRWEFDSIAQAASCISSWFTGTLSDRLLLKGYLDSAIGDIFYDANEESSSTELLDDDDENIDNNNLFVGDTTPCRDGIRFTKHPISTDPETTETHTSPPYERRTNSECSTSDHESAVDPTEYRDVLFLMRFNDRDLPFKLRQVIMSDLRLLRLLEAGLPSWVIFLQSYPGFCHIYRPWMCPLARALYVLISIFTVLIGFYDLYKNIPLLKAAASRICGPFFDWIETWEMLSRIKYLGTMLFLQNFDKAVKWFLSIMRTTRSLFSVILLVAQPLAEFASFFLPTWNVLVQVLESFYSVIWMSVTTPCDIVGVLIELVLSPICWIGSLVWSIGKLSIASFFLPTWNVLVEVLQSFYSVIWMSVTTPRDIVGDLIEIVLSPICWIGSLVWSIGKLSIASFFLPTWNVLIEVLESFYSVIWMFVTTTYDIVGDLIEFTLFHICWIGSLVWSIGKLSIASFFLPTWNVLVEGFYSFIWMSVTTTCDIVGDLIEFVLSSICWIGSFGWSMAKSILYSTFWILWVLFRLLVQMVLALANLCTFILIGTFDMLGDIWRSLSALSQMTSASQATERGTYEVSMWCSLWNDLFSQVFHAVRSILNGLVAFFLACIRHRLSINGHLQDFWKRLLGRPPGTQISEPINTITLRGNPHSPERRNVHITAVR